MLSFMWSTSLFFMLLMVAVQNNKSIPAFLYAAYALAASVYAVHTILYGTQPSALTAAALHETNAAEAGEFISAYFSLKTVLAVLTCWLLPLPFLLWVRRIAPVSLKSVRITAAALLLAVCAITLYSPGKILKYNPAWQLYTADRQYLQKKEALAGLSKEAVARKLEQYGKISKINEPVTLVVLIGESAARRHHGCYGYARNTTPFASRRAGEMLFFSDMISAAPFTVPSHASMLLLPVQNEHDKIPLMYILNTAGLQTWWLTSQYTYDSTASPLPLLADHVVSINASVDKQ